MKRRALQFAHDEDADAFASGEEEEATHRIEDAHAAPEVEAHAELQMEGGSAMEGGTAMGAFGMPAAPELSEEPSENEPVDDVAQDAPGAVDEPANDAPDAAGDGGVDAAGNNYGYAPLGGGAPPETSLEGLPQDDEVPSREEYEARFPLLLEAPRAATTFATFGDPGRFELDAIRAAPHFLVEKLEGTLWADLNADGARGSAADPTLNAHEFDSGVAGVQVRLVSCAANEVAGELASLPAAATGAAPQRTEDAGRYEFKDVDPGRYYVMYKAPRGHRLLGNVWPLERTPPADGTGDFDCLPRGGEGDGYLPEIEAFGDLDHGGYCARSIGCLEVGWRFKLREEYADLTLPAGDAAAWAASKATDLVAALPSADFLNVGLAEEPWPLGGAYQFADAAVTLDFPTSLGREELEAEAIPNDFATSDVKAELEAALTVFLLPEGGDFRIHGVAVHGGEIVGGSHRATETNPSRTGVRGYESAEKDVPQIKYKFTARGSYNPPPRLQLGTIVQDSINADPRGLVRTLREREGLSSAFKEAAGARARHLKAQDAWGDRTYQESKDDGAATWAVSLSILIAAAILALTGALLYRRVFVTRTKAVRVGTKRNKTAASDDLVAGKIIAFSAPSHVVATPLGNGEYGMGAYLDRGSGFVASAQAPPSRQAGKDDEGRRMPPRKYRGPRPARVADGREDGVVDAGRVDHGTSARGASARGSTGRQEVRSPPRRSSGARQSSRQSSSGGGEAPGEEERLARAEERAAEWQRRRRRTRRRERVCEESID